MKTRIFALLHLFVLLVFLAKPILPYIEYLMFKDYIAENLCENREEPKSCCEGKCHLQKQLEKNSETGESTPKDKTKKGQNKNEVKEFLFALTAPLTSVQKRIEYRYYPYQWSPSNVLHSIFVPPKG